MLYPSSTKVVTIESRHKDGGGSRDVAEGSWKHIYASIDEQRWPAGSRCTVPHKASSAMYAQGDRREQCSVRLHCSYVVVVSAHRWTCQRSRQMLCIEQENGRQDEMKDLMETLLYVLLSLLKRDPT